MAACSSEFHSCYETRTCSEQPQNEAGAAGDEAGGTHSGAGRPGAGSSGTGDAGSSGGHSAQSGADASGMSGAGGSDSGGVSGEAGAAGADCGEACACDGHACDCAVAEQRSCALGGSLGSCAAGVQKCGTDRHWGACSVQPKSKDTCAAGNDDTCNGVVNEGCPCVQGQQRPCSDGGLVGKCAGGTQTCTANATWGACSILPAAADTCVLDNNDNCVGPPNEGCLCIEGVTTRSCGVCQDGKETCTNGKTAQFGACVGASTMKTYYLDADGDGHAVNVSTTVCTQPAGYITGPVDDCYDSNANAFPGQTGAFSVNRGDGSYDYNCNNLEEPSFKMGDVLGCAVCTTSGTCGCATPGTIAKTAACGATFSANTCYGTPGCGLHGSIVATQSCK